MKKIIISFLIILFLPVYSNAFTVQYIFKPNKYYVNHKTYGLTPNKTITKLIPQPIIRISYNKIYKNFIKKNEAKKIVKFYKQKSYYANGHLTNVKYLKSGLYSNKGLILYGFAENSYVLTPLMKITLLKIKNIIKNKNITITGYTDHYYTKAYNEVLAFKRALAAEKFLNFKKHIGLAGRGKCCYISKKNHINRRIVIKITK